MRKNILRSLKLFEVSGVDTPCQEGAKAVIMKRAPDAAEPAQIAALIRDDLAKMMDGESYTGARTFSELAEERLQRQRMYEASEEIWPLFGAVQESIQSIVADAKLSREGKLDMIRASVEDFMNAVAEKVPDIERELNKLLENDPALAGFFNAGDPEDGAGDHHIGKGDDTMSDENKQVAELQTQIADLTKQVNDLTTRAESAEAEVAKAKTDNDEIVKVGTTEIRKSVVGPETFAVIKKQQEDIAKANETAEIAKAEDKVEKEFPNLPGDKTAKAKALMAIGKVDETARQTVETMLAAGNKALGDAMETLGKDGEGGGVAKSKDGEQPVTKSEGKLVTKAKEIQKRDSVSYAVAYDKAMAENPDLYDEFLAEKAAA